MNKLLKQILILICLLVVLILPYFVFAESSVLKTLENVAEKQGPYQDVGETTISTIAGTIVNAFLSLLGVIFVILIVYGGYTWMTARGEEEKINRAKEILRTAIVGLIIVVSAYAIWNFIIFRLV